MIVDSYMWCLCCGCGEEHNAKDPAMREKHRFCVANRKQKSTMPAAVHASVEFNGPKATSKIEGV